MPLMSLAGSQLAQHPRELRVRLQELGQGGGTLCRGQVPVARVALCALLGATHHAQPRMLCQTKPSAATCDKRCSGSLESATRRERIETKLVTIEGTFGTESVLG